MTDITSRYNDWAFAATEKARLRQSPSQTPEEWQRDIHTFICSLLNEQAETPPPPPPPADPQPAGWTGAPLTLVWHDEFDGDLSKWNVQDESTYGDGNNELQAYTRDDATIYDGQLHLIAEWDAIFNRIVSGMVTTRAMGGPEKFAFTHGYIETRMKVPTGGWAWPALWLVGAKGAPPWPAYGEIDVVEAYPEDGSFESNFHRTGGDIGGRDHAHALVDSDDGFHTFAVLWTADSLTWIYDGVTVRNYAASNAADRSALALPHTIHLNLAVGGNGPADHGYRGDAAAELREKPEALVVDHVRVWQP